MSDYEEGFYWVKPHIDDEWEVGQFANVLGGKWVICGGAEFLNTGDLHTIGKRIPEPDKENGE